MFKSVNKRRQLPFDLGNHVAYGGRVTLSLSVNIFSAIRGILGLRKTRSDLKVDFHSIVKPGLECHFKEIAPMIK